MSQRIRLPPMLAPALIAAAALLHCLLYIWLVPLWQAPDEPAQFEYAALVARLGRVPTASDIDAELDAQIGESLARHRFYEYLQGETPDPPPPTFSAARERFFMPRQVGGDPPLPYLLGAALLSALPLRSVEAQLLALRLLGSVWVVGAALCAYAAGRALSDDRRVALGAGLLVALQPMFAFIGGAAGNDGLANLCGATTCCAALLAINRPAWRRPAVAALALLLPLGLLVKTTLLPAALLLFALGLGVTALRAARLVPQPALRVSLGGALLLAGAALVAGVLAGDRTPDLAADWHGTTAASYAPRVDAAPATGRPALVVHPGKVALQALPDVAAEWTQDHELAFSSRVWSPDGATGWTVIDFGVDMVAVPFAATGAPTPVLAKALIPKYCPYIHVALFVDTGTLYADELAATSARQPGLNVLANADATGAAVRPGSLSAFASEYLRLRELRWAWHSGQLFAPMPLGPVLARIFFASFWGQFGWMSVPLVGDTPWEGALLLICAVGLLGALVWACGPGAIARQRWSVGLLLALLAAGALLVLLNAYTQPRQQIVQQGRYLFPALVPLALLLALGWRALVPPRWRGAALAAWAAWWLTFAGSALALIVKAYHY
jgi:hypothetical protein